MTWRVNVLLRRAAVFFFMTPLVTATSNRCWASRSASWAAAASPDSAAARAFLVRVFISERRDLLRWVRTTVWRLRFFWDLMLAMSHCFELVRHDLFLIRPAPVLRPRSMPVRKSAGRKGGSSLRPSGTSGTGERIAAPRGPVQCPPSHHWPIWSARLVLSVDHIRNFSIIAHIDHGKSTLADRLLERAGTISSRDMREQVLDSMDIERERGITIKAQAVRLDYRDADGEEYVLNLIDTPGHVDFSYEVSRSLAACEGALLLVDAAQGVEAQTLANAYLAIEAGLEIIPVVNKIDLPAADPQRASAEIAGVLGIDPSEVIYVSAKKGEGIDELLRRVVSDIPPPTGSRTDRPRALIFDSYYDSYRGVVSYIRVVDGTIGDGDKLLFAATEDRRVVTEVGVLRPGVERVAKLGPGEVGYLITGIKTIGQIKVGDTVLAADDPAPRPLPGYAEPRPMVFSGLFPSDGEDFERLREALDKLALNDASLVYQPETSASTRIRVSGRLPRPVAHGHHPRATRTRIRTRSGGDGTVGRV